MHENDLTQKEVEDLLRFEEAIRDRTSPFYESGRMLLAIRDARLFRRCHQSFQQYCRERWHLGRIQVYRLIKAAAIVNSHLLPLGNMPLPTRERQVRELDGLAPDEIKRIWTKAVQLAGGVPTSVQVHEALTLELLRNSRTKTAKGTDQQDPNTATMLPNARKLSRLRPPKSARLFTRRENEILRLISSGLPDKAVAATLGISYHTVRAHLKAISKRIKTHSRNEAVVRWRRSSRVGNE